MEIFFPYKATTRGLTVRVAPAFLAEQSDPARGHWFWGYHVRLENNGADAVQLISRRWLITDGRGLEHEVVGDGVVGEQPMIAVGASYDYVSGCPLNTPTGSMEGSYHMISADGSSFEAAIPRFQLIASPVAS